MEFVPLDLPAPQRLAAHLGAFHLEQAWQIRSNTRDFGSYSALLIRQGGALLAISDAGGYLRFHPPGMPQGDDHLGDIPLSTGPEKRDRDVESATQDPAGTIWLGLEGSNSIYLLGKGGRVVRHVRPASMVQWAVNTGPEAMVRLQDGRFIVLGEGFEGRSDHLHSGVLFAGDPTLHPKTLRFRFDGPATFSPTDMAQMPDGRVLILMRTLVWPIPERFAGRIVIADPRTIRSGQIWHTQVVATLGSDLPIDNFEGLAIDPRADGTLTVWLISDDNYSQFQRTLLWKLRVNPADLPL